MTASQIRAELLKDHAGLRTLIEEVRLAVARAGARGSTHHDLRERLQRLATALSAHNQREEAMLRAIVKQVDAWGPVRAEIMDESHLKQHTDLVAALFAAGTADAVVASATAVATLEHLETHMAREEEVLLAEDVLRDDEVVIDYFGG
jgi:iron-sulfur cluster repair protein YtfE (RIC family)